MNHQAVTIIGSYLSPYVRKVLVCLGLKQIDYVIDPGAVFDTEELSRSNPLSRVPVYMDGSVTLTDSTVICEYLEDRYPQPALYPATPQARARARWLEEYADTRMGEVFIWRLFNERVIKPIVRGLEEDEAVVKKARETHAPQILDYLELEFSSNRSFLASDLGIAEIAVASFMRNAAYAGYLIDAQRWPVMHVFVNRALQHPVFSALNRFEQLSLRTPQAELRAVLLAAGAPICEYSCDTASPRRPISVT